MLWALHPIFRVFHYERIVALLITWHALRLVSVLSLFLYFMVECVATCAATLQSRLFTPALWSRNEGIGGRTHSCLSEPQLTKVKLRWCDARVFVGRYDVKQSICLENWRPFSSQIFFFLYSFMSENSSSIHEEFFPFYFLCETPCHTTNTAAWDHL